MVPLYWYSLDTTCQNSKWRGGKKQEIELQNYWFVCFSVFLHLRCVLVCLVLCVCVCMPWRRRSLGCSCMLFCSFATVIWSLGWRSLKLRSVDRLWVDFEFEPTSCLLLWLVYAQHFLTGVFHQGGLHFFFLSHRQSGPPLWEALGYDWTKCCASLGTVVVVVKLAHFNVLDTSFLDTDINKQEIHNNSTNTGTSPLGLYYTTEYYTGQILYRLTK